MHLPKSRTITAYNYMTLGSRHSSVDSSVSAILPPQVRVPCTPSMLLSLIEFVLYLSCEKNENKQKGGRVWPLFLQLYDYNFPTICLLFLSFSFSLSLSFFLSFISIFHSHMLSYIFSSLYETEINKFLIVPDDRTLINGCAVAMCL